MNCSVEVTFIDGTKESMLALGSPAEPTEGTLVVHRIDNVMVGFPVRNIRKYEVTVR